MSQTITQKKYVVLDKKMNVAEIGVGPILVMIHGWSNSWVGWTPLAIELASHYKIYMIDMLGFGDSDELDSYTIENQTKYVAEFIQNLPRKPVAIIGASLGTIITANLVHKYPNITTKVILLGAVFNQISLNSAKRLYNQFLKLASQTSLSTKVVGITIRSRYTAYLIEKYLNAYTFNKELIDKYSLPGRKKMKDKCYIEIGISALDYKLEEMLRELKPATLIIYGEADKYVTPSKAHQLLALNGASHVKLEVIKEAGHNPAYEQPLVTAFLISRFLKSN